MAVSPGQQPPGEITLKKCGIYRITHIETKASYVGSSANIGSRLSSHRCDLNRGRHPNGRLQNAWSKYGPESFELVVIEICAVSDLLTREQHWMDELNSADRGHGFNIAPISGTRRGVPQPKYLLEKIRAAHLGKPKSQEMRDRSSATQKGRIVSEEKKELLRQAAARQWSDPAQRQAARERATGKSASVETRAKMAASQRARHQKEDNPCPAPNLC